jgi:hypothetical protein
MEAMIVKSTVIGIVGFMIGLLAYHLGVGLRRGELGLKPYFVALQSAELRHRNDADTSEPVVEEKISGNYTVLGIPTSDRKSPRAWIVINVLPPDGVIRLFPNGTTFYLSCTFVEDLQRRVQVTPTILTFLRHSCGKERSAAAGQG